jgi:osmotically-inducible protein OsmY
METDMSKIQKLYGLVPTFIVMGAMTACATVGTNDAQTSANVQAALNQHPELGAPGSIDVQTFDHVVYLHGIVSQGMQGQEAEQVALQQPGVSQVQNLLAASK